jgi:hypothetical protein
MPILELPKSKLVLHADELLKYGPDETVMARYRTDRIVRLGLEKSREYGFGILLVTVFAALAYVAHRFITSPGWSWTVVIGCLGVCGLAVLSIEGRRLVIETADGTVRYPVVDAFEDAEGFVLSASAALGLGGAGGLDPDEKDWTAGSA